MIRKDAKVLLEVKGLRAKVSGTEIVKGLDLVVRAGEVHAIMGPNGSGKSTFAKALAGHPSYQVTGGTVTFEGKNLFEMTPEARSRAGLFLGFQYPVEIPGVSNSAFLRLAYNTVQTARGKDELDPLEFDDYVRAKMKLLEMDAAFLDRSVNEGFSGGEKKRNEILQMALLDPRLAILDETDSGLDIDALRVVAGGVNSLATADNAVVLVTHYQRMLNYIVPDYVHVMGGGRIIKTGGKALAEELEAREPEVCRSYRRSSAFIGGFKQVLAMSTTATHPYIEALLKGYETPRGGVSWLNERRAQALERANALTVPTTRDEEWRFTDITSLIKSGMRPAAAASQPSLADLSPFIAAEATVRLVFVDGVYAPGLSVTRGLPEGIVVAPLAAALGTHAAAIEPHLARHAGFEDDVFAALNTAWLRDGAYIHVAKNRRIEAPVQVLYVSTQKDAAVYPRCLLVAEAGADCTLIEDYVGLVDGAYFNNAVTEVVAGEGASVSHVRVQREAGGAFHIATCAAVLAKDSYYASHSIALGARLSRLNLNVLQQGDGVEVKMDGLALISGRQLADTHTLMDHLRPNGSCQQLHKCIVGGGAHAVFNGKIVVRPGAQLTDSAQQSRVLLLSDKARVDAKPQLEIFADDVKCAHGAAIGQIDAEQLFYLQSRGLSTESARNLLTYAFAAEVVDRIPVPSLVARLEKAVLAQTQAA